MPFHAHPNSIAPRSTAIYAPRDVRYWSARGHSLHRHVHLRHNGQPQFADWHPTDLQRAQHVQHDTDRGAPNGHTLVHARGRPPGRWVLFTHQLLHSVSPELDQPLPVIQAASVFFSPDPNFAVVSIDNDITVNLASAAVAEPGAGLLLATGLAGLLGLGWRGRYIDHA